MTTQMPEGARLFLFALAFGLLFELSQPLVDPIQPPGNLLVAPAIFVLNLDQRWEGDATLEQQARKTGNADYQGFSLHRRSRYHRLIQSANMYDARSPNSFIPSTGNENGRGKESPAGSVKSPI